MELLYSFFFFTFKLLHVQKYMNYYYGLLGIKYPKEFTSGIFGNNCYNSKITREMID